MSHKSRPYADLGEQIDHLMQALALAKGPRRSGGSEKQSKQRMQPAIELITDKTGYADATVYRWRQGRLCPPDETLKLLARTGKEEAGLNRDWGEKLFRGAGYSELEAGRLADEIWGLRVIRPIPHNLPPPLHTRFIGKQAELERLLKLLSPRVGAHLITIDGIGGVGKTTLALEAAYRCLRSSTGEAPDPRAPAFDAIIFISAKQQFLTPGGIRIKSQAQRTLRDIFHEIARTLNQGRITHSAPEEQRAIVAEILSKQPTLLIVDNLETVEDKDQVLDFLEVDLTPSTKVVITTRERVPTHSLIRLEQFSREEALELLAHEAQEAGAYLNAEQMQAIYERIGGIPAALIYTVGQIAAGYAPEYVLGRVVHADSDIARFCFEGSVAPLRGQAAHLLLMATALFPKRPQRDAIIATAGLSHDPITADSGLARLKQLSLISERDGRFSMLPLTREFALAELAAHPDFEREARKRWLKWFSDFCQQYGGYDWLEWHIQYDRLEEEWENLQAVFAWCAEHELFDALSAFWAWRKGVGGFANLYGHWDDRLTWYDWLIQAAERRGDWPAAMEAMSEKSWTLVLMGRQLDEAEMLLKRAWGLLPHGDLTVQSSLANNIAALYVRKKEYEEARRWLDQNEALLAEVNLAEQKRLREWIPIPYYRAEICYWNKEYDQAKALYRQVLEHGKAIGWQRAVIYAQNWLADIAIKQGDLDEAESLLQTGFPVAERNKDKRRTAFYKRSFALLEQKRGNLVQARSRAVEALDGFERLGMQPEADEMRRLLEELASFQETGAGVSGRRSEKGQYSRQKREVRGERKTTKL